MTLLKSFIADQSGATAIEYGLVSALIAVSIVAGLNAAGTALKTLFTTVVADLKPH